jgi:hypothetical protein
MRYLDTAPALDALLELSLELFERFQTFGNVVAHVPLGILHSAGNDRIRDLLVPRIRQVDALGVIERGEQQAIDRDMQALDEHAHVLIARPFDDQAVPLVIEPRELVVIAGMFDRIQIDLDLRQARLQFRRICRGKVGGCKTFERHTRTIDLPDFVAAERLDGSAAKLLDRHETFGGQTLQRFADTATARAELANDIGFDETLSGHEPSASNALSNPVAGFMHRRHAASRRNLGTFWHRRIAHRCRRTGKPHEMRAKYVQLAIRQSTGGCGPATYE